MNTAEKLCFCDVRWDYRKGPVAENGFMDFLSFELSLVQNSVGSVSRIELKL